MGFFRFLLAISVLLAHSNDFFGLKLLAAETAVKSFYVISGFYMAMILSEKYIGNNASYFLYIKNRLLKIYPLYWLTLLVSIFYFFIVRVFKSEEINVITHFFNYYNKLDFQLIFLLIFSNLFIFFQDVIIFLGYDFIEDKIKFAINYNNFKPPLYTFLLIPQAWTVCLELYFYLIAPFLIKVKRKAILIWCFILSILVKIYMVKIGLTYDPWSYRFFISELYLFVLGSFSYMFYIKYKSFYSNLLFKISIVFVILVSVFYSRIDFYPKQIIFVFLTFLLIPIFFIKTKKNKFDRILGDLSYPIYIIHILVINILSIFVSREDSFFSLYLLLITIVVSIFLKFTFLDYIELKRQKNFNSLN